MKTYAKMISDSISATSNIRLCTMELCYPLIVHAELMTHRMFSRNAASNRAIPTRKIIEQVEIDAFYPTYWGSNQSGMQAGDELTGEDLREAHNIWENGISNSIKSAQRLNVVGLHKQIANRVLMPYQYIKVIVTATEWDNFFNLRLAHDAQPEIQELARCMKEAMDKSTPKLLNPGDWHLPYILDDEWAAFNAGDLSIETLQKASSARCARISFLNHDKSNPDLNKDVERSDSLRDAKHRSPFEHQATPMDYPNSFKLLYGERWEDGVTHMDRSGDFWSGNLRGFLQYRQLL